MELTYAEHGATRGELPAGYRHVRRHARLGSGQAAFGRAVDALFGWDMHRGAGLGVLVAPPQVAQGEVVVLRLGPPIVGAVATNRIVWVERGERRAGFAYGTLPRHPERGEEAFLLEWTDDDSVWLTISAFSRLAGLWRFTRPVAQRVQDHVTDRFVQALRRAAQRG